MTLTKNEHGYYEVRVKGPDGKYHSKTTGKKNKDEAKEMVQEAKLAELELAAEMGVLTNDVVSVLTSGRKMTVDAAIQPWSENMLRQQHLSQRSVENNLTWVKAWAAWGNFGRRALPALKQEHFDAWINGEGVRKLGTRKVMLSAIRGFCQFCRDSGWLLGNPANLVNVDKSLLHHAQKETLKRECFTEEEVSTLLATTHAYLDQFWHTAILIGYYTGLRLGDICCLEWDCLDLNPGKLTVWTQKRDKRVQLPLEPIPLSETLAGLSREHKTHMFPQQRNIIMDPKCRAMLSVQFGRICRLCGISGKTFHCLRTTYINDCKANGIPMEHISKAVGHSRWSTTEGYLR